MAKITEGSINVRLEGLADPTATTDAANKSYVDARVHGTGNLADGSVTTAKLADDAVTQAKIGAGAVGTTELADDAVTSAKISFNLTDINDVSAASPSNDQALQWNGTAWVPGTITTYTFGATNRNGTNVPVTFNVNGSAVTARVDTADVLSSFITGSDNTNTDITFTRSDTSAYNSSWVARLKANTVGASELLASRSSLASNDAFNILTLNSDGTEIQWSPGVPKRVETFDSASDRNASTINWYTGDFAIVTADGNNNGAYVYVGTSPDHGNGPTGDGDWQDISGSVDTNTLTPAELLVTGTDADFPNTGDRLVLAKGDDSFEAIAVGEGLELSGDDLQVDLDGTTLDRGTAGIKIRTGGITSNEMATDSVVTAAITDANVTTDKIADDNVTQAKIADDAVGADQLAALAVVTGSIVDDAVTNAKIADDAVNTDQLADGAVNTARLADDAVTAAKIADNVVGAAALNVSGNGNDHQVLTSDGDGSFSWENPGAAHIADNSLTPAELATGTDEDFQTGQVLVSAHDATHFEAVTVGDRLALNSTGNRLNVDGETYKQMVSFDTTNARNADRTGGWYRGNLAFVRGDERRAMVTNSLGTVQIRRVDDPDNTIDTQAIFSNVTTEERLALISVGNQVYTASSGGATFIIASVGALTAGNEVTVTATQVPPGFATTASNAFFNVEETGENQGLYIYNGADGKTANFTDDDWVIVNRSTHAPPKEDFATVAARNEYGAVRWRIGDICSVAEEVYTYTGPTSDKTIDTTPDPDLVQQAYADQVRKGPTTTAEWTQIGFTGLKGDTIVDVRSYTRERPGFGTAPGVGHFNFTRTAGSSDEVADGTPWSNTYEAPGTGLATPEFKGLNINNLDSDSEPFRAISALTPGSVVGVQSLDGRDQAFWEVTDPDGGFFTPPGGRFIELGNLRAGSTGTYRRDQTYRIFMIPNEVPISAQAIAGEGVKNRTRYIAGDGSFIPAPIYTFNTFSKGLVPPTNEIPALPMPSNTARSSQVFGYDEGATFSGTNILDTTSLPENTWFSLNGPGLPSNISQFNAIMYPTNWNWATDGNIFAMMRCSGFSATDLDVGAGSDNGFRGWIDSSKAIINFTVGGDTDQTNGTAVFTLPTRTGTQTVTITGIVGTTDTAIATAIAASTVWNTSDWLATSAGTNIRLERRNAGTTSSISNSTATLSLASTLTYTATGSRDGIDCPAICYRDGENWAIFYIGEFAVSDRDTGSTQPQVYFTLEAKGRQVGGPLNRAGDTATEWYFGMERNRTAAFSATAGRTTITEGSALATTLFLRSDGNWASIQAGQLDASVIEPNAGLRFYPGATGGRLGLSPAFIQAASTLALTTSYQYSQAGSVFTSTGDGTNGQVALGTTAYVSGAVTPATGTTTWAAIRSVSVTRYDLSGSVSGDQDRSIASLSGFISAGAILEVRRDASNYAVWAISSNLPTNGNANHRTFNVTNDFADSGTNDQYGNDIFVGLIESQGTPLTTEDTAYTIIIHGNDEGKDGRLIFDDTINTAKIRNDAITQDKIATNAVGAVQLANDAVDTAAIVNLNVTTAKLAADAVTNAKLADDAVETANITDLNVTTGKLAADAVTNAKLADNAVETANITDLNVTTGKLAADAVTNAKLADNAVETANITDANVTTAKLADTAVTTAKITDDAVTQAKIADDAVGADQLASDAVVTASIVDANVTTAKIANDAVDSDKIATNAVTADGLADDAVDTNAIANLAVTNAKIANDTIAGGKLDVTGTRSDTNRFLTLNSSDEIVLGSVVGDGHVTLGVIEGLIGDTETLVSHSQLTFDSSTNTLTAGRFRLFNATAGENSSILATNGAFSDIRRMDINPPSSGQLAAVIGRMVVGSTIYLQMGTARGYFTISNLNVVAGIHRFLFSDATNRLYTDGTITGTTGEVYLKPATVDIIDGASVVPQTIIANHLDSSNTAATNEVPLAVSGGGFTWSNPTDLNRDMPSTDAATIEPDDLLVFIDESDTNNASQKIQFQNFTGAVGTALDGRYEPKFAHALAALATIPSTAVTTGTTQLTGNVISASSGAGWGFYDGASSNGAPLASENFTTGFPSAWSGFFTGTREHISFNLSGTPGGTLYTNLYNGHVGNENIYILARRDASNYAIWRWNQGTLAQQNALYNGSNNTPALVTTLGTPGTSGTDTIQWYFNLTSAGAIVAISTLSTSASLVRRADDSWGQVDTAQLADNAVTTGKIANGAVGTADLAATAVTQAKIANDAVGADQLAALAVVTGSIVDANVTTAKIADNNITTAKILDGNVTHSKIGLDAVDQDNLDFATGVTPAAGQAITIGAGTTFNVASLEEEISTPYVPIHGNTNWPASVTAERALSSVARVASGTNVTALTSDDTWGTYNTVGTQTNAATVAHWQNYFDTSSTSTTNVVWNFGGTATQAGALVTAMNTDSNTRIIAAWTDEDNWCVWDLSSQTANLLTGGESGIVRSVPGVNFEDYILASAGVPQTSIGWAMYTNTGTNYLATGTPLRAATGGDDLAWSSGRRWVKFIGSDGGVGTFHLADGSVTTVKLADMAVTNAKLGLSAVTNTKISDGAVDSIKLSTGIANNSGATFGSDTLAKSLTFGNTHYRFIDVVQNAANVNLVNDETDSQAQITTFTTSTAGVVPSSGGSMVPNWAGINAGTFAHTEDLAYNTTLVTNGGRGWIKFNGSSVTTLTEGTTTWQQLLFAPGNNVNDDQVRFDDDNLSDDVIGQITGDTDGRASFIIICDHNNWAIVDYNDGTGDVFGQDAAGYSYAQSGRTGQTADGTIVAQKGMPRSHARIYLPFNAVSGAKVTNLVVQAGSDDQFLAADGRFVETHSIDLNDPNEYVQEVDSTQGQTIHRDSDGNVTRVIKQIRFGDYRQDVTVVFVRTSGQVTSVTYNYGDFGASGTISASHLIATKTITRTAGSVSSVSIA